MEKSAVSEIQSTDAGKAEIPRSAPTRTLEKGLFLLGLFDADHPEWTLRELRERAGLPKATTRRLMKTLEAANWVAYDPDSGKYHLGSSALRTLYLALSHSELVRTGASVSRQADRRNDRVVERRRVDRSGGAHPRYRPDRAGLQADHLRRHASQGERQRRRAGVDRLRLGADPGGRARHPTGAAHSLHGGRPRSAQRRSGASSGARGWPSTAWSGTRTHRRWLRRCSTATAN